MSLDGWTLRKAGPAVSAGSLEISMNHIPEHNKRDIRGAFDKTCWFAERFCSRETCPSTKDLVDTSDLFFEKFRMNISAGVRTANRFEVDPGHEPQDLPEGWEARFAMPFDSVAVDYGFGVIFFLPFKGQSSPGISIPRIYLKSYIDNEGLLSLTAGSVWAKDGHWMHGVPQETDMSWRADPKNDKRLWEGQASEETRNSADQHAAWAVGVIYEIVTSQTRWIMSSTPINQKSPAKGRIRRSHQRTTYTALTIPKIQKVIPGAGGGGGTHASPVPHARRGHWKTYHSDFYTNMHGKTVWVDSTWVGPKEHRKDGKVYKVLTHK